MKKVFHAEPWRKPGARSNSLKQVEHARKVFHWRDARFRELWAEALAEHGTPEAVFKAVADEVRSQGFGEQMAEREAELAKEEAQSAGLLP